MYNNHVGTNHPQGNTGETTTKELDAKHLGFEGEVVTTVHGRNGVGGKVPEEEEQQIRPRTGVAGTAQGRQAAAQG